MSAEENKAVIRRYMTAVDAGDVNCLDEFLAPNFVSHNPFVAGVPPTRDGGKEAFLLFVRATPGYHTVDDLIAEGDKVAARITGYGTHEAELLGIPATHKAITMSGIVIWRLAGGKIVEHWAQVDLFGLLQQLGVVSTPTG
jgi:predicted ester cyclase